MTSIELRPAPPAITAPPRRREVLRALARRDVQTCGWIASNADHPFTCDAGLSCARDDTNSVFGCCNNPAGCQFYNTCVQSSMIGRVTDTDTTLYCSERTAPACQNFYDDEGYESYFCGSTYDSFDVGSVATNQNGIDITTGAVFSTFFPPTTTGSLHLPAQPTGSKPNPTQEGASPGTKGNGTNGGASASATNSGISTAAIAGIAVAAALIGLAIIAVIVFLVWKNKKAAKAAAASRPFISQPHAQHYYPQGPAGPAPPPQAPPPPMSNISGSEIMYTKNTMQSGTASSTHPSQTASQYQPYPGVAANIYEAPTSPPSMVSHSASAPPPPPSASSGTALSSSNLNSHLASQEWSGIRPDVVQRQTAAAAFQQQQLQQQQQQYSSSRHYTFAAADEEDDGLGHLPELRPQDAAGEPRHGPGFGSRQSWVRSDAGQTALYPASEGVWHQNV